MPISPFLYLQIGMPLLLIIRYFCMLVESQGLFSRKRTIFVRRVCRVSIFAVSLWQIMERNFSEGYVAGSRRGNLPSHEAIVGKEA